jgi:hypothetical protein
VKSSCQYLTDRGILGLSADSLADLDLDLRQELVEHLRACSSCRRDAVEENPTVVFSLLETDSIGEAEIAEIQASVRTLRRSRAIETAESIWPRGGRKTAMVAASLVFALALLPLAGGRPLENGAESLVDAISERQPEAPSDWQSWVDDRTVPPVIEELNRPEARVYQLTEEDLAVVMIVDETLDL